MNVEITRQPVGLLHDDEADDEGKHCYYRGWWRTPQSIYAPRRGTFCGVGKSPQKATTQKNSGVRSSISIPQRFLLRNRPGNSFFDFNGYPAEEYVFRSAERQSAEASSAESMVDFGMKLISGYLVESGRVL
ncbi:hypothetical protein LXL04_022127 [Taraxacum kok-saghyz]